MLKMDLMAIFAKVATSGSFTAAAKQLGLPKSTVSQRVAELESIIDLRLLHRTTRSLSLTEAGRVYLGFCQAMLGQSQAADAALSKLRKAPSGELRITAPEATSLKLMPSILAEFKSQYPQVELTIIVADAFLDLVESSIDVAFRTGRLDDSSFISRRVGKVKRVLVASPEYLLKYGRPGSPGELLLHQCLVHQSIGNWRFQEEANEIVVTPSTHAQLSNSMFYLMQASLIGQGITMLPEFLCREEIANERLEIVLPNYPISHSDYYAVYPSRSHPSAALSAFLEFVGNGRLEKLIS